MIFGGNECRSGNHTVRQDAKESRDMTTAPLIGTTLVLSKVSTPNDLALHSGSYHLVLPAPSMLRGPSLQHVYTWEHA